MWKAGTWTAYWAYGLEAGPPLDTGHELTLAFDGERVSGRGLDSVGRYTVKGWTTGDRLDVSKRYVGMHELIYQGRIGPRGCLVGHWMIGGPTFFPGRFIWVPPGSGDPGPLVTEWFERVQGMEPAVEELE